MQDARAEYCAAPNMPGYQVIRRLGHGGSGVVYQAKAPGGFDKAIKVVRLDRHNPLSDREAQGLQVIRSIRHPYLLSIDRVDVETDRITLVMELADGNMRELFQQCVSAGDIGIPRARLLPLIAEAAEALDVLNFKYRVHHLDVKPENLFMVADHVKVGDYGLVREADRKFIDPADNAVTPAYAAPELFDAAVSDAADQYSLAVVYMEMATGQLPYRTANVRQLALYHLTRPVDASLLPAAERPIVIKALSRNPKDRYPSCMDFAAALLGLGETSADNRRSAARTVQVSLAHRRMTRTTQVTTVSPAEVIADAEKDKRASVREMLTTRQTLAQAVGVLKELANNWQAEWLDFTPGFVGIRLQTRSATGRQGVGALGFCFGGCPPVRTRRADLVDVTVSHHGQQPNLASFEQHAGGMMAAIRGALEGEPASEMTNLRRELRNQILCSVTLMPASGMMRHMPIPCTAVDFSSRGIGVVSMIPLEGGEVRVRLPFRESLLRARVAHCKSDPESAHYFIGLEVIGDDLQHSWLIASPPEPAATAAEV